MKGKPFYSYLKSKLKDKEIRVGHREVKTYLKVAKIIEEARIKSGLTQAQLAKKANVSQPMIARLEEGYQDRAPALSTISKVLSALGHGIELTIKKVV